jgi:hypothetical protein
MKGEAGNALVARCDRPVEEAKDCNKVSKFVSSAVSGKGDEQHVSVIQFEVS